MLSEEKIISYIIENGRDGISFNDLSKRDNVPNLMMKVDEFMSSRSGMDKIKSVFPKNEDVDMFVSNSFGKKTTLYKNEFDYVKLGRTKPNGWICKDGL